MCYFPVIILYITGWMWDVLLPSYHSLHHRVDVGCLTPQSSFCTSQCGCGMSYFPAIILHITRWRSNILLLSQYFLCQSRMALLSQTLFSISQIHLITTFQQSYGKTMYSVMYVCLSVPVWLLLMMLLVNNKSHDPTLAGSHLFTMRVIDLHLLASGQILVPYIQGLECRLTGWLQIPWN